MSQHLHKYAPRHFPSGGPLKRHVSTKPTGRKNKLDDHHPAVVEARTKYPHSVVDASDSPRLLIEGKNSRKIGNMVTKGRWRGCRYSRLLWKSARPVRAPAQNGRHATETT